MDGNFEAIKYIPAIKVRTAIEKYKFHVEPSAQRIIEAANPEDVLSIRLTINSPLQIIKAVNVSNDPDAIFAVAEE